MTVVDVIDVDVEVTGDDYRTMEGGDDLQHTRELIEEHIRKRQHTGAVDDDVDGCN